MDAKNVFTAHAVETGISNGITTEIISGVAEGTTVVTEATMSNPFINAAPQGDAGRSPFMPGPPDRGNNKKDGGKK